MPGPGWSPRPHCHCSVAEEDEGQPLPHGAGGRSLVHGGLVPEKDPSKPEMDKRSSSSSGPQGRTFRKWKDFLELVRKREHRVFEQGTREPPCTRGVPRLQALGRLLGDEGVKQTRQSRWVLAVGDEVQSEPSRNNHHTAKMGRMCCFVCESRIIARNGGF